MFWQGNMDWGNCWFVLLKRLTHTILLYEKVERAPQTRRPFESISHGGDHRIASFVYVGTFYSKGNSKGWSDPLSV